MVINIRVIFLYFCLFTCNNLLFSAVFTTIRTIITFIVLFFCCWLEAIITTLPSAPITTTPVVSTFASAIYFA